LIAVRIGPQDVFAAADIPVNSEFTTMDSFDELLLGFKKSSLSWVSKIMSENTDHTVVSSGVF
jgi:hypothetical protein